MMASTAASKCFYSCFYQLFYLFYPAFYPETFLNSFFQLIRLPHALIHLQLDSSIISSRLGIAVWCRILQVIVSRTLPGPRSPN